MPINHKKTDEFTCPKCGKDHSVVEDFDFDFNCMVRKMYCDYCGHIWREYFAIAYDGFSDDSGEYDSNGVQLASYTESEG